VSSAADPLRRLRLVNRTSRPWVLAVFDGGETADTLRVVGSLLADPFGESGALEMAVRPRRTLHGALVNHVHYDSLLVSAVVTSPQLLPDRPELLLEAVVEEGVLRLGVAGWEARTASPSGG